MISRRRIVELIGLKMAWESGDYAIPAKTSQAPALERIKRRGNVIRHGLTPLVLWKWRKY